MRKKPGEWVSDQRLFYPGRNLSQLEKDRIESYDIEIGDITSDHLVYAMSRQIEINFQIFYGVAEELIGEEKALELAFEIGRRYGGAGYAKFLAARGLDNEGGPRLMAQYQDLVHSIRGPKHTAALFAVFDSSECVVRRDACIYFSDEFAHLGKFTGQFERGCFEGYKAADRNLAEVVVEHCVWQGSATCHQVWRWDVDRLRESGHLDESGVGDDVAATGGVGHGSDGAETKQTAG